MVDLLVGAPIGRRVAERLSGAVVSVPAHFDAEVLSALGRLRRSGGLTDAEVEVRLEKVAQSKFERSALLPLLAGAWSLRRNLRLVDALYVELARQLNATVITTDSGLGMTAAEADLIV